jgi:hypothetical protein
MVSGFFIFSVPELRGYSDSMHAEGKPLHLLPWNSVFSAIAYILDRSFIPSVCAVDCGPAQDPEIFTTHDLEDPKFNNTVVMGGFIFSVYCSCRCFTVEHADPEVPEYVLAWVRQTPLMK